jgi:hypothetical protein
MNEDIAKNKEIGRNEPCPCGSGKKYKRCHGVGAAPKITLPRQPVTGDADISGGNPLANMDPQMMTQFSQALRRLPHGQMQRLQSIMQKAMSGKDVSREAAEFEKTLPPEFKKLMEGFHMPEGTAEAPPAMASLPESTSAPMSEEDARRIVAEAAAEGKISEEQADTLLGEPKDSGISKLWRNLRGK